MFILRGIFYYNSFYFEPLQKTAQVVLCKICILQRVKNARYYLTLYGEMWCVQILHIPHLTSVTIMASAKNA
jgi:hypothetical protein